MSHSLIHKFVIKKYLKRRKKGYLYIMVLRNIYLLEPLNFSVLSRIAIIYFLESNKKQFVLNTYTKTYFVLN